jgi:membrane fusion protein (multidrug efflux system)
VGNKWVVSEGLKGGERIIVEGFQKAKPGSPVTPQAWQPAQQGAQPAPAAKGA